MTCQRSERNSQPEMLRRDKGARGDTLPDIVTPTLTLLLQKDFSLHTCSRLPFTYEPRYVQSP